jgi:hypothetical protein
MDGTRGTIGTLRPLGHRFTGSCSCQAWHMGTVQQYWKVPLKRTNPDGSTVIVMDLSFKYLGRHLDFGVSLAGPSRNGFSNWQIPCCQSSSIQPRIRRRFLIGTFRSATQSRIRIACDVITFCARGFRQRQIHFDKLTNPCLSFWRSFSV